MASVWARPRSASNSSGNSCTTKASRFWSSHRPNFATTSGSNVSPKQTYVPTFSSFQQLANDRQLSTDSTQNILPVNKDVYRLVVIDEAHAYRNSDNSWYIALDRLMSGTTKKLLMLTATPVNNSLWDLHNLFLLFARHDGAFADAPLRIPSLRKFFASAGANKPEELSEPQLFPLIDALTVRRDRNFVVSRYRNERFKDGTRVVFPEPKLEERRYDLDDAYPGLVNEISNDIGALTMARYRHEAYLIGGQESASQETIAAFMQSMLLKRFESSWYAALRTTERMIDAIERILASIKQHGVVPIGSAIEDVRIDADSGIIIQDELFEGIDSLGDFISTDNFIDTFVKDLENDVSRLGDMESRLKSLEGRPDPKLETLRRVMANTPSQKVAIFSSFGDTVEYLVDHIQSDPSILNGRAWIPVVGGDTDPNQRARAIERFCPASESEAANGSTTRPDDEVDVLISTDVLSEGQNLQQAQAVLSYDMPWNPQRVVQRNGRVIRLRSPHDMAFLYTLLPEDGALEKLLKLESNIQAKILAANASIGMESPVLKKTDAESRIYADLQNHTNRLATGDVTLLDEKMNAAFAGEFFRSELMRAHQEGELQRIRELPWGIGAAFVPTATSLTEPAVFFAYRTRNDERYWRMVSTSGDIVDAQDLEMMFHINPSGQPGCDIPSDIDFDRLFNIAADDIVEAHNQLTDPTALEGSVPASQRWALEILTSPDAPEGQQYDDAHASLSIGRNRRGPTSSLRSPQRTRGWHDHHRNRRPHPRNRQRLRPSPSRPANPAKTNHPGRSRRSLLPSRHPPNLTFTTAPNPQPKQGKPHPIPSPASRPPPPDNPTTHVLKQNTCPPPPHPANAPNGETNPNGSPPSDSASPSDKSSSRPSKPYATTTS